MRDLVRDHTYHKLLKSLTDITCQVCLRAAKRTVITAPPQAPAAGPVNSRNEQLKFQGKGLRLQSLMH